MQDIQDYSIHFFITDLKIFLEFELSVSVWVLEIRLPVYIYIFIAVTRDESIFLDVLHFPMKNIKSHDLEATPMGGGTSKPIQ